MVAILAPTPHPIDRPRRPDLRVVHGGTADRPGRSAACYRRRRVVAAFVAVLVLTGLVAGSRALLAPLAEPAPAGPVAGSPATGRAVVVQPGDTLWTIARRAQPAGDIRPLVDRLVAAHGSGPLVPGERVTVPG